MHLAEAGGYILSADAAAYSWDQFLSAASSKRCRWPQLLGPERHEIRPVFDVGAFEGDTSRLFRGLFSNAVIRCFEPAPEEVALLSHSVSTPGGGERQIDRGGRAREDRLGGHGGRHHPWGRGWAREPSLLAYGKVRDAAALLMRRASRV